MNKKAEINLTTHNTFFFYPLDNSYALRMDFNRHTDVINYTIVDLMPFAPDLSCSGTIPVDDLAQFLRDHASWKAEKKNDIGA